jgi:hypothetical protein
MQATLTKYFNFSASFERAGKIYGHNYRLGVVMDWIDEPAERGIVSQIETYLILPLQSVDLSLHVPWLAAQPVDDRALLLKFAEILSKNCSEMSLKMLTLERDRSTTATLCL